MKEKGITLIALTVTIIVLIILASITIGTLTGENGIIKQARQGKESTEIGKEKEAVDVSSVNALGKNKFGNIEKSELQNELNNYIGDGKTKVIQENDKLYVQFIQSDRYYKIDNGGTVEGPVDVDKAKDKNAGNIFTDANGNELTGDTEDDAYQINCIEDLCALSNYVNKGNNLNGKYVKLMRNLDFNSEFSYISGQIQESGEIESCNSIEELRDKLTNTDGEGFIPIGNSNYMNFNGTFDGQNYEIKNLYENIEILGGLFGDVGNAVIQNITISGEIMSKESAGGVIAIIRGNSEIINCINKINVSAEVSAGGICGDQQGVRTTITNCINYGKIAGKSAIGGICGDRFIGTITNCINYGEITSDGSANYGVGGIIGNSAGTYYINNSINYGKISYTGSKWSWYFGGAGGIVGLNRSSINYVDNVVNLGEISSTSYYGGICGMDHYYWDKNNEMEINNAYFLAQDNLSGIGSMTSTKTESFDINGISTIVSKLNSYIEEDSGITEGWKKWKIEDSTIKIEW